MPAERNRVLAGERISRARVESSGTPELSAIEAALAACDHEEAALLAIARARKATVPVELVARIAPGIELATTICGLVAIASGDKATLVDVIERRAFPQTKDTAELEGIVLYAAWKAGAPAARVLPELRRISVRSMTAEGYALIAAMARTLGDANANAVVKDIDHFADEYAKSVAADERAMGATPDAVVAALPAEVELSRGGFTVRAAQKPVGRNDPCSCGSGLKFKKCCADKPVATPSPVPGVAWEDFLSTAADQITAEHVGELELRDVVKIDFARMQAKPLVALVRRLADVRAWSYAERALAELDRKGDDAAAEDARDWLIQQALHCGELELVRAHVAKLSHTIAELYALDLAAPNERWETLVTVARAAVASDDKLPDIELAYALLRVEPALGIIAARACIGTLHVDDPDALLDTVEEARDQLGLPPSDPAWRVLDALTTTSPTKASRKRGKQAPPSEDKADRAQLLARIDELERALAKVRAERDAERTKPAAELARTHIEDTSRIGELEGVIREGQAERAALRRELAALQAATKVEPKKIVEEVDDDDGDELPPGTRNVTLPRFDRKFADSIADVPQPVAAEALRTVGVLASGDGFVWKGVKQAKDMVRPLLMTRVGIHHRLLFRVEDGVLDVLDLITRETLLTVLKRIRGAR
jgi:SEC-C motif